MRHVFVSGLPPVIPGIHRVPLGSTPANKPAEQESYSGNAPESYPLDIP
jgi:hypothetical protein